MIHTKKLSILFFSLLVLLNTRAAFANLNVFACEPEWASLVQELGGKHVQVVSATNGAQDPHHVQARPSLLSKARKANLLVCTGADLEIGWLPLLQRKTGNPAIQNAGDGYFMASQTVSMLGIPASLDRSSGDVHEMGNPHIHTDPNNINDVAEALNQRLQLLDPDNAEQYESRYQSFKQRWQTALKRWNKQAKTLRGKRVVVYHKSWIYMNDWLGLKQVATLEPKPGIPPSSDHLSKLLKKMQKHPADIIIYAAYQSPRSTHWLSERTSIPVVELPFTVGGIEGVNNLFDLYNETLRRLQQATSEASH